MNSPHLSGQLFPTAHFQPPLIAKLVQDDRTKDNRKTHFGYSRVSMEGKREQVGRVFDSVAPRYDLMNDLMSFGIHRLWKAFAAVVAGVRPSWRVLDLACGSGDLSLLSARRLGPEGRLVMSDINASMLDRGRRRMLDAGFASGIDYVLADAEALPFADNSFDCVTIGFGLRNVADKEAALRSIHRILRYGGALLVLEFSRPLDPAFARLYDRYSFSLLPALGRWVVGDEDSYRYLAESIRMHPPQPKLAQLMQEAGFAAVKWLNLSLGVVAVHRAYKV